MESVNPRPRMLARLPLYYFCFLIRETLLAIDILYLPSQPLSVYQGFLLF